jgi:hypothetical protein
MDAIVTRRPPGVLNESPERPMTGAMKPALRLLIIVAAGALALAIAASVAERRASADGRLRTSDGDTVDVTAAARRAGLTFAPAVAAGDRLWILAALARARPEAARLIAEVDGLVEVRTIAAGGSTLGITRSGPTGFTIDFDVARLDGDRALDRPMVVLHEFGHVVDFALVPRATDERLDALIPSGRACGGAIDCELAEERFADTFARWALNGAVSVAGAGYGIPLPASLEDWGAPLGQLAFRLPA